MEVKSKSEVAQSCPIRRDPMDCSLPGSSVHRIFQARVLEWGAIAFSHACFMEGFYHKWMLDFVKGLLCILKLEPIMQSEVSQKEKHQYSILTHIYGI